MLDTVERAGVKIETIDQGVLKVSFEKGTIMTLEATEYFFDYFEGQEDDGLTILADIRNLKHADIKVRKFILKRKVTDRVIALSLVVENGVSMMIGSFILGINRPSFPVKIVRTEEQGWQFLNEMKVHA